MTISSSQASETFIGNGATNTFDFTFVGDSTSYITVMLTVSGTTVTLDPSSYTIVLNPPATGQLWGVGGTLTYPLSGSPIANGSIITITRTLPLTQTTSISNQGAFYPQVIERALDTLEMQVQQVNQRTGQFRGVWASGIDYFFGDLVIDGANGNDTQNYYYCVIANTSTVWATDLANGDWQLAIDIQSIETLVAEAEAAEAAAASSATAASASAGSAATSASNASSSASSASTSATNAASSASSASASATSASTSATNSANSATASASSATASAASAASAAAYALALTGTSTTSTAIGTGAKTFTTQASKQFIVGQYLVIASNANNANYMHGQVTSYSGTTLVMNITDIGGSGTFADWQISISGTQGPTGPTGPSGPGGNDIAAFTLSNTGDAYSFNPSPALSTYATPVVFFVTPASTNTTTSPTIDISNLGPLLMLYPNGTSLAIGAFVSGQTYGIVVTAAQVYLLDSTFNILANGTSGQALISGGSGVIPTWTTKYFNPTPGGSSQGAIPVENSSHDGYTLLSQGTSGQILTSAGADANPTWATNYPNPAPGGSSAGAIVVENAGHTGYTLLSQGTSGQTLISAGADANPAWTTKYFNPTPGGSTQGAIPIENSTHDGYTLLTQGTSGQVLTSAGANADPTWTTPTAYAWTLLATSSPSSATTIDFTSGIGSTYFSYVIIGLLSAGTFDSFQIYYSGTLQTDNGGGTYGYDTRISTNYATASNIPNDTSASFNPALERVELSFSSPNLNIPHIILFNGNNRPLGTPIVSSPTLINGATVYSTNSSNTGVLTGIRLNGTSMTGTVKLYGIT